MSPGILVSDKSSSADCQPWLFGVGICSGEPVHEISRTVCLIKERDVRTFGIGVRRRILNAVDRFSFRLCGVVFKLVGSEAGRVVTPHDDAAARYQLHFEFINALAPMGCSLIRW